jgi:hypothetical protein
MGCFSWKTCDTNRSIPSGYSTRETFTVYMVTPLGRVFKETDYEGYGVFGGKDFYELLSELNGGPKDREHGISIAFKDNPSGDNTKEVIYPKLFEHLKEPVIFQYNNAPNPLTCPYQGYFYNDEEEECDIEEEY